MVIGTIIAIPIATPRIRIRFLYRNIFDMFKSFPGSYMQRYIMHLQINRIFLIIPNLLPVKELGNGEGSGCHPLVFSPIMYVPGALISVGPETCKFPGPMLTSSCDPLS